MAIQDIANALQGIKARYQGQGPAAGGEAGALQAMSDYVRQNNLSAADVAAAANTFAPDSWDVNRVQQTLSQYAPTQYGLDPALAALSAAGKSATQRIDETQKMVGGLYDKGLAQLAPFLQQGTQANQLQAALSGALGPEEQAKAFQNYQQSPGVAFAQQEAEKALLRNASATGGLSGGNVLRDLSQLAAGTYMQDFGNQFNRLGTVADRGYGSATTGAGLYGQQAGVQAGLGQFAAGIPLQIAQQQAGMQFQAGRDIAGNIGGTSSALANLVNQQGAGMSDTIGNFTNNINSLLQGAAQGDASSKEQLATILANLGVQGSSQMGSQPIIPGASSNLLGQLGGIASGLGGLYYGLNAGGSSPLYNQTSGFWQAPSMITG